MYGWELSKWIKISGASDMIIIRVRAFGEMRK